MTTSFMENLLCALERNGFHPSPDAIKLAEASGAIPHKGVMTYEWTVACFYAALKACDCHPVSLSEFVETLNRDPEVSFPACDEGHIMKFYRKILRESQMHAPRVCNVQPTIYLRKLAEQLSLPPRAFGYASRLSEETVRRRLHVGRNPSVVAAAIIQLTKEKFKLKLPKKKIADTAGCTTVSVLDVKRYLASRLEV